MKVEEFKELVRPAICTRGKNKGLLLSKCPKMDTPAAAAWQAVISIANPYKLGFGHLLFMSKENRAIYDSIVEFIEVNNVDVRSLDKDRRFLDAIGIW